jgi:hypothetical protein
MITRSALCIALVVAAATALGCGSSTPSDVTSDTDAGTAPAPATDSGTVVDAGGPACTTKTYANFGQAFFAAKCNGCHAIQRPVLTTQTGIRTNASICKSEISRGSMPQGSSLSTQEKADVLEWLNCGAP